jgi:signal transduction histidine kinase
MSLNPRRDVSPSQDNCIPDVVARQVMADNPFLSMESLERAAMQAERLRLARELHDGVLQSLAGTALELEALASIIGNDPRAACQRLHDIEELIFEEQRELRTWIHELTLASPAGTVSDVDLATALKSLCHRVERQWGLRVKLTVARHQAFSLTLGDQIYRLVQEGLSNIAKHAHAQVAHVAVGILHDRALVVIADDGRGFRFRGRYDLAALNALQLGPASIKERVALLRGELVLNSTPTGSRLAICLPFQLPHDDRDSFPAQQE